MSDAKIFPRSKVEELVRHFVVDNKIHALYGKCSEGEFVVHFLVEEEWITEKQLEQAKVQAEEIYKDFVSDCECISGEQEWNEIEIDGQYFDIEVFDEDMDNPRTLTYCSIYPTEEIGEWRETDGTRWIRLFGEEETA